MFKREHIKIGKCIWCGRTSHNIKFYTKAHVVSHNMGGDCIAFGVCDKYNSYFGTSSNKQFLIYTDGDEDMYSQSII